MDTELSALRWIAKTAQTYQDKFIQRRTLQRAEAHTERQIKEARLELEWCEFELSQALDEWFQMQPRLTLPSTQEPTTELFLMPSELAWLTTLGVE